MGCRCTKTGKRIRTYDTKSGINDLCADDWVDVAVGLGGYLTGSKYTDRAKYKAGDKTYIVYIPDVVIYDRKRDTVINGEGKTYANRAKGYEEMENFDFFEDEFVKKYYPESSIERTLVLYGSKQETLDNKKTGLLLNENGLVVLGENAPALFKEAFENLLSSQ